MEIGERLKEAREAKQLSLDAIQDMTKIQKRYLVAIEEGNFHILPGKFYARAFIKEYASAVGLNPDELFEQYKFDIPTPQEDEQQTIQYSRLQRSRKDTHATKSSSFSFFPTLIVVLLVIGIMIVAVTLYQQAMNNTDDPVEQGNTDGFIREDDPDEQDTPAIPDTDQDINDTDEFEDDESTEPEQELELIVLEQANGETTYALHHTGEPLTLSLQSSGRTWLAVENEAGETLYNGELTEADSPHDLNISTESKIYIKMGFAPDLQVFVNDVEVDIPSEPHVQVIWIEIEE